MDNPGEFPDQLILEDITFVNSSSASQPRLGKSSEVEIGVWRSCVECS
jgi:hypothetical protein